MEKYLSKINLLRGMILWCWSRNIIKLIIVFSLILMIVYYASGLVSTQQHVYLERLTHRSVPECPPPPSINGSIIVIQAPVPTNEELEKTLAWVESGGHYSPGCKTKNRAAILIPYRNRQRHLALFLLNIHPFLRKQQIEYTIFIIEQYGNDSFSRGTLFNAGYKEAKKIGEFDCIFLHDVDHIPEFYQNMYTCPEQPRHMAQGIRIFNKSLDFFSSFGGVVAMANEHYELINGFSNRYWGWGGEDDDMYYRVLSKKLKIIKYPHNIAWYTMLSHEKAVPNPQRFAVLGDGARYYNISGLNNVNYTVLKIEKRKLYTYLLLDIVRPGSVTTTTKMVSTTTVANTTAKTALKNNTKSTN